MTAILTADLLMSACNGGEKKEEQPKYDDRPNETYVLGEVAEEFDPEMAEGGFGLSIIKDLTKSWYYQYKNKKSNHYNKDCR